MGRTPNTWLFGWAGRAPALNHRTITVAGADGQATRKVSPQVVGGSSAALLEEDPKGGQYWTRNVNQLLPENSGWTIEQATDINDNGVIAATGWYQGPPPLAAEKRACLLLPVDIKEVISDQIADRECNKLPTAYYKGEPNNPMLMATRSGRDARLAVRIDVPADFASKFYVGARKIGTTTILGSAQSKVAPEKTLLTFEAIEGHETYEVVAGYDANGNSTLDDSEAQIVFEKTPKKDKDGNPATTGLNVLDKVITVTEVESYNSMITIRGYNAPGTEYAGHLIEAFADGSRWISSTTLTDGVPITSTTPGLSHKVGAKWDANCQDTTYRFTFPDASPTSDDFESSNAIAQIIDEVINENLNALLAAGGSEWTVSGSMQFTKKSKDLIVTEDDPIGFNELGLAFGKVDISGNLRVNYRKTGATSIEVGDLEINGAFDDLYDFSYWGGEKARKRRKGANWSRDVRRAMGISDLK